MLLSKLIYNECDFTYVCCLISFMFHVCHDADEFVLSYLMLLYHNLSYELVFLCICNERSVSIASHLFIF